MRVLFVTPPVLKSHLYVQTPLASALQSAGHQVRVAVQPDLVDGLAGTGLTGVVVGEDMLETLIEVDKAEPVKGPRVPGTPPPDQADYAADDPHGELAYLTEHFLQHLCASRIVDDLVRVVQDWRPDLVIWDQLCYAGAVAAQVTGTAHMRLLFGTDALVQLRQVAARQRPDSDPMGEWLQRELARYGSPFDEDVVTGQWTIDTMPPWVWQPEGPAYVPMRHLAFNGSGVVPEWLYGAPARPRVCLTLGLSHQESGVAHASTSDLLEAVADLDAEIVAAIGGEQGPDGPPVPDNVRLVDFVPLHALLPSCAVIVHQGGTGTFATAYEHGVPQLVVPSAYWSDKWFGPVGQASALAQQGAGLYVADSDTLTADALRDGLVRVLGDPSFTAQAERLRRVRAGLPTPHEAVSVLERLTGGSVR